MRTFKKKFFLKKKRTLNLINDAENIFSHLGEGRHASVCATRSKHHNALLKMLLVSPNKMQESNIYIIFPLSTCPPTKGGGGLADGQLLFVEGGGGFLIYHL